MSAFYRSCIIKLASWSAGCGRYADRIECAVEDALAWACEHRMRCFLVGLAFGCFPCFCDAVILLALSFFPFLLLLTVIEGLFAEVPLLRAPLLTLYLGCYAWLVLSQVHWSMLWPF